MKILKIAKLPVSKPLDIWQRRQYNLKSFLKERLVVHVSEAIHMIELNNILFLSAESNYTRIHLKNGTFILSSKTLKYYEMSLIDRGFLRVHAGYIVNLDRITGICREEGYSIDLENGVKIPISRTFKIQLFSNNMQYISKK